MSNLKLRPDLYLPPFHLARPNTRLRLVEYKSYRIWLYATRHSPFIFSAVVQGVGISSLPLFSPTSLEYMIKGKISQLLFVEAVITEMVSVIPKPKLTTDDMLVCEHKDCWSLAVYRQPETLNGFCQEHVPTGSFWLNEEGFEVARAPGIGFWFYYSVDSGTLVTV